MTGRVRQPEWDSQNEAASRTGQTVQYYQHNTARRMLLGLDSQSRTAGIGQPEEESQNRTARMRQAEKDRQKMACRKGLPGQDCLYRSAKTGIPGQDCSEGLPGNDFRNRTARAGFALIYRQF
jgi:hypothetical protein